MAEYGKPYASSEVTSIDIDVLPQDDANLDEIIARSVIDKVYRAPRQSLQIETEIYPLEEIKAQLDQG